MLSYKNGKKVLEVANIDK